MFIGKNQRNNLLKIVFTLAVAFLLTSCGDAGSASNI